MRIKPFVFATLRLCAFFLIVYLMWDHEHYFSVILASTLIMLAGDYQFEHYRRFVMNNLSEVRAKMVSLRWDAIQVSFHYLRLQRILREIIKEGDDVSPKLLEEILDDTHVELDEPGVIVAHIENEHQRTQLLLEHVCECEACKNK